MKKRLPFVLLAGLAACAYLIRRQPRPAPTETGAPPARIARDVRALDAWQGAIRLDANTDYPADAAARCRLLETLRAAERKQPPQEGRN